MFKELTRMVVVDSAAFKKLGVEGMQEVMEGVVATGKPFKMVEDFTTFGRRSSLLESFLKGDEVDYRLEYIRGEPLTEDEQAVFTAIKANMARAREIIDATREPYKFAPVPGKGLKNYDVGTTRVSRDTGHYSIGVPTLKFLWDVVKGYWNDSASKPKGISKRIGDSTRGVTYHETYIQIDCQRIERWELEQLALHYGWEFPK